VTFSLLFHSYYLALGFRRPDKTVTYLQIFRIFAAPWNNGDHFMVKEGTELDIYKCSIIRYRYAVARRLKRGGLGSSVQDLVT